MPTHPHPHLTERARDVLALAHSLAARRGDADVAGPHVALGLLEEGQSVAVHVLRARGVPLEALARELAAALPVPAAGARAAHGWTEADEALAAAARREAAELDWPYYGAEHLLLALLRDQNGAAARVLNRFGVGYGEAREDIRRVLAGEPAIERRPAAG